jgi:hypothetical protein
MALSFQRDIVVRGQPVISMHPVARRKQVPCQVKSDEACTSGDEDLLHALDLLCLPRSGRTICGTLRQVNPAAGPEEALAAVARFRYPTPTLAAGWRRGYAADCKSVKTGSIPVPASRVLPPNSRRPAIRPPLRQRQASAAKLCAKTSVRQRKVLPKGKYFGNANVS